MRWRKFALASWAVVAAANLAGTVSAQTLRVDTRTQGRMTQMLRSDGTVDAGRVFGQRLAVHAFDALGTQDGSLNVHAAFRFWNDFGLVDRLKDDHVADMYWSQTVLESAYVDWRPVPWMFGRLGRHTRMDALGARDVDGVSWRLTPRLGPGVRGLVEVWAGQDVLYESSPFSGDFWDVQGVAEGSAAADAAWSVSYGGRAGISHADAGMELAWLRRSYGSPQVSYLGEERFGLSAHGQISRTTNVVANASYHTLLEDVDRARLILTSDPFGTHTVWTGGVERVIPVFDSGSIFNVFGAQPFEGAWVSVEQGFDAIATTVDARFFGRIYEGDQDLVDLGEGAADATTYGVGAGHRTDVDALGRVWTLRSVATYSDSVDGAYGGRRILCQSHLRVPATRRLALDARGLYLHARPQNARYPDGWGVTGVLGAVLGTELGELSAAFESSHTTFQGQNVQLMVAFDAQVWR